MNDEQFEALVSNIAPENVQAFLRARDTAQREALARVEAERDALKAENAELVGSIELEDASNQYREQQLKANLAEAVGKVALLVSAFDLLSIPSQVQAMVSARSFLARHAQAELQEAQGAQVGDERAAFEDWYARKITAAGWSVSKQGAWWAWQERAALATQPAGGEPVAWIIESPEGCSPCKSINHFKHMAERYAAVGWSVTPLYAAPPAAAHGDDTRRIDWLACTWRLGGKLPDVDHGSFREVIDAAMRAQGDGEVQ